MVTASGAYMVAIFFRNINENDLYQADNCNFRQSNENFTYVA